MHLKASEKTSFKPTVLNQHQQKPSQENSSSRAYLLRQRIEGSLHLKQIRPTNCEWPDQLYQIKKRDIQGAKSNFDAQDQTNQNIVDALGKIPGHSFKTEGSGAQLLLKSRDKKSNWHSSALRTDYLPETKRKGDLLKQKSPNGWMILHFSRTI